MCAQNINSLFACLGCPIGDDYIIGDDCQSKYQVTIDETAKLYSYYLMCPFYSLVFGQLKNIAVAPSSTGAPGRKHTTL